MSETHNMDLIRTFTSGAECWQCPECGYMFFIQWQPYKKIMLEPGDESAYHVGCKGGLSMSPPITEQDPPKHYNQRCSFDRVEYDPARLEVFEEFLRGLEGKDTTPR